MTVLKKGKFWKRAELSAKSMGKDFHKLFKIVVNEQKKELSTLRESG